MAAFETVFDQAMGLSLRDRARLIEKLVRAFDPPGDELSAADWQQEWAVEIRERLNAADRGDFDPRPWRELCDDIRSQLGTQP